MLVPKASNSGALPRCISSVKDRELDRAPARAAPCDRPMRSRPALGGENARPAHDSRPSRGAGRRPSCRGSRPAGCRARTRAPRRETRVPPRSIEDPWVASRISFAVRRSSSLPSAFACFSIRSQGSAQEASLSAICAYRIAVQNRRTISKARKKFILRRASHVAANSLLLSLGARTPHSWARLQFHAEPLRRAKFPVPAFAQDARGKIRLSSSPHGKTATAWRRRTLRRPVPPPSLAEFLFSLRARPEIG